MDLKTKNTKIQKSKHQKLLEKKLRKWQNSSYQKLQIESLLYTRNGESMLSLRQFQPGDPLKTKKSFGDILVFNKSNIDSLIQHLFYVKRKIASKTSSRSPDIIIDEWDINSTQSVHRRALGDIAVNEIMKIFSEIVRENCIGCQDEIENQMGHELCLESLEKKIDYCFRLLMEKIEISDNVCKEQLLNDNEWVIMVKEKLVNLL